MKITICQMNPTVGDIAGNLSKIVDTLDETRTDLVVFPELFLTGYPPKDLLERPWFIEKTRQAVQELLRISKGRPDSGIVVGAPEPTGKSTGKGLFNSALLIHQGRILLSQPKTLLPNYDVFDETRYFDPAPVINTVSFKGETLGISICEDAWNDPDLWPNGRMYAFDPIEALARKGATIFINISASPFHIAKEETRFNLIRNHARKHRARFVFVNQVGANDELVFDGRSLCLDQNGDPVAVCPSFQEHRHTVDTTSACSTSAYQPQGKIESVYEALVLGIRDYMRKCGFSKAVVGLSGGIDSALTCCLAKAALGSHNVLAVSMPSPYSSKGSIDDSKALCANLGIEFKIVPTGKKSELAVGYCTLYGDMSGGLAVISDVPKTMVYELASHVNRQSEIIPRQIIEKPPSAELKPDQVDQDTLPPYPVLDEILRLYIEEVRSVDEIIKSGFDETTVRWVCRAVEKSEYKRKQAAPGLKVTTKAFGVGRRMPIAAKYER